MKIKTARFVVSNTDVAKCPLTSLSEYAFIGRSNVGKSSLINMLMNRKNLAKTSRKPGKTQLINHFLVNDQWFLVDLPGYGYAQTSKTKRAVFQRFITEYLLHRKQLCCTFVLIDVRHSPQRIDLDFMQFLGENTIPFCIVFTKTDKLKANNINQNIAIYQKKILETWETMPTYFITSAIQKTGREELLYFIAQVNRDLAYAIE